MTAIFERIEDATCEADLFTSIEDFAELLGFPLFSYRYTRLQPCAPTVGVYVGNTPADFLQSAMNPADSRRDPVLAMLRATTAPFTYDEAFYRNRGAGDLWSQQALFGYRVGVCCSMRFPNGEDIFFGLDRSEGLPSTPRQFRRLLDEIHGSMIHLARSVRRVHQMKLDGISECKCLTDLCSDRQIQVLYWLAQGRTQSEVATVMDISVHTVRNHVVKAMRALGASGFDHAVVEAMRLGLLDLKVSQESQVREKI